MGRFCKSNETYFLVKYESVIGNCITHSSACTKLSLLSERDTERERVSRDSLYSNISCVSIILCWLPQGKRKNAKEMSSSGDVTSVAQDDAIEILLKKS